ncbi:flavodoxin [Pseudoflavonifractor phocaeensis]|uniref:flavodoxin n=1 Tax=Pseudoflavonifractor phocaeensis TaxID=1870988 RepID=UPI00195A47D4|nr:flavodoxin [Pseudoflavonifractor phocaeensis]MBM6887532.1 flavodoxin [Pseudoflavonifractor phocaeensis]
MKRMFTILTALTLACALTACGETGTQSNPGQSQTQQEGTSSVGETSVPEQSAPPASSTPETGESGEETAEGGVLVAYFSATGNTEGIAQHLQSILDADLYEIVPEVPYTDEDLNYSNDSCRANQEQNDPAARPAITGTLEHPENYDVVFLGYPIWWGQAPKVMYTFLESYDLGDATIVPFCTSGSSGIGGSLDDLHALAPEATWLDGQRFSGGASQDEVTQWVDSLDL